MDLNTIASNIKNNIDDFSIDDIKKLFVEYASWRTNSLGTLGRYPFKGVVVQKIMTNMAHRLHSGIGKKKTKILQMIMAVQ